MQNNAVIYSSGLSGGSFRGQSLAEFALVLIVLIPILVGVIYVGIAMYEGSMASNAIKEPTTRKNQLADQPGAVASGTLLAMATGGFTGNRVSAGNLLDNVNIVNIDNDTSLMVGSKTSTPIPFLGTTFTFSVSQAIQRNLLANNTAATSTAPGTGFKFCATGVNGCVPPWSHPRWSTEVGLPRELQCQNATITLSDADSIFPNSLPSTYQSTGGWGAVSFPQAVKYSKNDVVLKIANMPSVVAQCPAAQFQAQCQTEFTDLQYQQATPQTSCPNGPASCVVEAMCHRNPPGAPNRQLCLRYEASTGQWVSGNTFSGEVYPPPHGSYFDPSGQYTAPPASMVADCVQRKVAECKVYYAARLAQDLAADYPQECP